VKQFMEGMMKRVIAVVLLATGAMAGAASAQAQTSRAATRSGQPVVAVQQQASPTVARQCSGIACLQGVPSLGVAF
jgi:ABC-type transport system substrate-binding protein